MPQVYSYPGVYVEEIPSGVRTITGVPTSIAAFVGRAKMGPTNEPITIFSFEEFERQFGGLWPMSSLGYAVRDFYLNAPGGQAIIVRIPVTRGPDAPANTEVDTAARLEIGDLKFVARSLGAWGNMLRAKVDYDDLDPAIFPNPEGNEVFNLTISVVGKNPEGKDVVLSSEVYRGVSTDISNPRRIDTVLESESRLMRLESMLEANTKRPPATEIEDDDKLEVGEVAEGGKDAPGIPGEHDVSAGLEGVAKADIFNLLVIPPLRPPLVESTANESSISSGIITEAINLAETRRAMFIIDPSPAWDAAPTGATLPPGEAVQRVLAGLDKIGDPNKHAAVFFPRIRKTDSTIQEGRVEINFAPSGAIAGVFARTDSERGVWKAPAGIDAVLRGAPKLSVLLSDQENGRLNPKGVNALRVKPGPARVIWGARTRVGNDDLASEWKYIPVRRVANFIEESLFRGTQWVVFETNDEPLWASIRLNVTSFLHSLFRLGAFQGSTPSEAYFVKCDRHTTTQDDVNRGIVNIVVGFAPLKPAEFVVIKLQQIAGSIET